MNDHLRPLRLDLKVGFSCNNRCTFCVQGDKRDQLMDRTTDELLDILRSRAGAAHAVVLTGGEATIRADIVELVQAASDLGYTTIQLQTNGRRLSYRPFVKALVEAGVTEVSPALHGSRPEIHDGLTRAKGAFKQVVKGIRNVREAGLPVISNTVVVQDNVTDLPQLAQLLAQLGANPVQFAFVHPAGTAGEDFDTVVPRFSEAMPYIHAALDILLGAGITARTEAVPYCFMQGYEACVAERLIPNTAVEDLPMIIEDYTAYRLAEGKAKGAQCERCSYDAVCEGPWREYPEHYGWDEVTARTDAPV